MADHNVVAIYIRVSTMYQIDKDSLPMQRKDLIAYSNLILNTDDYTIYEDAGYSGKNTDRPQFQKMMTDIRSHKFTHLLVWKIDRVSRNLLDFASMYAEIKELGVTFVSKNEQFDTSTAMGEAMLKIILVFAELERNMTSERVLATMISRAANGQWNGGHVPYGYTYDSKSCEFSINPEEARIVKMIHDDYEKIHSLTYVSRDLNSKGYRTKNGREWSPIGIAHILNSVFYSGSYRYNVCSEGNHVKVKDKSKWITVADHHPAIVSEKQKTRVIALLNENDKLKRKDHLTNHVHVFGGMVYCGNCDRVMWSSVAQKKRHLTNFTKYICPTTRSRKSPHCVSTSDLKIGEFVFNFVLNILNLQKEFDSTLQLSDIQKYLLFGTVFHRIKCIDRSSLQALYDMLSSGSDHSHVFGKQKIDKAKTGSEQTKLIAKRNKLLRAIERLNSLYLYSDKAMGEQEYLVQKNRLDDELKSLDLKIQDYSADPWENSLPDDEFISVASNFIIQERLSGRNYINYEHLAETTDPSVLQSFVRSIIQYIYITDGEVSSITFKNRLECHFTYISMK